MTAAVILAAGGSSRLGRPKQLVRLRGKTLVRHMVDAAFDAGCSPVVVVTGSNGEKIDHELQQSRVVKIQNNSWQRGIGSSIRSGVKVLLDRAAKVDAVVLLVCDQPFVKAAMIRELIILSQNTGKEIVASSYGNTLGVPALFSRRFFHSLLSLEDGAGAKQIILRNRECVAEFLFPEGSIDIDSWSDYQRATDGA